MKHKPYCCDASASLYSDYYARQNGGEIPVFAGSRFQRGHGLGSILGGFMRRLVLPFFQSHGKDIALNVAKTGMKVADDVMEGRRSFKNSMKNRVPTGIKRGIKGIMFPRSKYKSISESDDGDDDDGYDGINRGGRDYRSQPTVVAKKRKKLSRRQQGRRRQDIFS